MTEKAPDSVSRWVPPFFTCGECGGEIGRWPMLNLLKQEILDWRHRTVPEDCQPHRAVLGTPVPLAELKLAPPETEGEDDVVGPDPAPPSEIPAVSVETAGQVDGPGAAVSLELKGKENDWRVRTYFMRGPLMDARWKFNRTVSSVVVHLDRDGHRLVATWTTKTDGAWVFDQAWSLGHFVERMTSIELRAAVGYPRMICATCSEPPALHILTPSGLVCHAEHIATTTPQEAP
jgi:hypothetical protein